MRRLFEAAARVLRDRREMTVAVATAIVAVILIGGGQGNLAAIIAAGAAGLMGGHAKRYRLEANELFRELIKTKVQAAYSATAEAERHRVEVAAWHRRLEALAKEAREHLASLKRSGCQYCWYAPHLEWELKRADRQLAKAPMREQVQLIDLFPKENVDEFYSDTEEVNTTDTATAEEE